jgi:hypothetical protein
MIDVKSNTITKGVATLEKLFYLEGGFRKSINTNTNSYSMNYEFINLGTAENPKREILEPFVH